jgi:hypothetical protein
MSSKLNTGQAFDQGEKTKLEILGVKNGTACFKSLSPYLDFDSPK